jgi:hypothetical protein
MLVAARGHLVLSTYGLELWISVGVNAIRDPELVEG